MATFEDLLNSITSSGNVKKLENTRETWERIANKDSFPELENQSIEEWIQENPYSNIA